MSPEDNHDINSFFAEMRKKEMQQPITEFEAMLPKRSTSTLRYIIPISIAASFIVGFGIWTGTKEATMVPENTLFITLGETEENEAVLTIILENTRPEEIVQEDQSVYNWEPASSFLIKDFN